MGELGLVPIIHAMDDTPEEALWKLASIARSPPDLTIVALDAFSSYEATRQCFFVADVAPNVVFDTSLSYNFDFIEEFARRFGQRSYTPPTSIAARQYPRSPSGTREVPICAC
jgi:hypothetical protein